MWITVHLSSIGAGFGAVIVLTFLVFSAAFLLLVSHNRVHLRYLILQAAFLLYLAGFALYTSGTAHSWTIFWFRICVTGLIFTPLALELFLESLLDLRRPFVRLVIGLGSSIFLFILWGAPSLMVTGEIVTHARGFTSVVKGPVFPLFAIVSLGAVFFSLGWFCRRLLARDQLWRQYRLIITGLCLWLASMIVDALTALKLVPSINAPWVGPVAMVITVGLYLGSMVEKNAREMQRQTDENEALRHRLKYDPLTSLFSREFFNSILEIEAESWARSPQEHSILFIDADNFKGVNDQYGHIVGDRVLKMIGSIVKANVRRSDIPARYGGDEFIILLKNCGRGAARDLGEKIIREYNEGIRLQIPGVPEGFSGLSIGISSTSLIASGGNKDLIAVADEAMYQSKQRGKNRVVVAERQGNLVRKVPAVCLR
jgi:diguanylate cyclase (GGDEF)-like protein